MILCVKFVVAVSLCLLSLLWPVGCPAPTSLSSEFKWTDVTPEPGWLFGVVPPQQPQWTIHSGTPRPPGTFLLNMLIKNEAVHLERTLPKWAKIIDYWIVGVDDNNTDSSPDIIRKHLGHLPGHIEIVHFDGMGPTWTILVRKGLELFPAATHGIIADADFMPMVSTLDKYELDLRCSKHMYTIWTEDHRNERKMDWIYRNIKGAKVTRRTHQIVEVPKLPDQEVFQTLINLPIEEREGGYQDRSGAKNQRYIGFLEADLAEYPDDTRTLYYLGYAHHDIFAKNKDHPTKEDWDHLEKGVKYFVRRGELEEGNAEERWFALLKIAEIYERYYRDWDKAKYFYDNCTALDPERADAWFYLGQHYRLWGDPVTAIPYLKKAASLPIPQRSLFQWHYLYHCLSKLEYGRAQQQIPNPTLKELKTCRSVLRRSNCLEGDPGNDAEMKTIISSMTTKINKLKAEEKMKKISEDDESKKKSKDGDEEEEESTPKDVDKSQFYPTAVEVTVRTSVLNRALQFYLKHLDAMDEIFSAGEPSSDDDEDDDEEDSPSDNEDDWGVGFYTKLMEEIDSLTTFHTAVSKLTSTSTIDVKAPDLSCRSFRMKIAPITKLVRSNWPKVRKYVKASNTKGLSKKWEAMNEELRAVCR